MLHGVVAAHAVGGRAAKTGAPGRILPQLEDRRGDVRSGFRLRQDAAAGAQQARGVEELAAAVEEIASLADALRDTDV